MTRQELIQELMQDSQTYCCYCGAPKVSFGCCGENHFETFAEMNKETQESILNDMASEVSDFWKDYVPEPVKPRMKIDASAPLVMTPHPAFQQPAQRKPLTDEEIDAIPFRALEIGPTESFREFARAIEAAHGIKENT